MARICRYRRRVRSLRRHILASPRLACLILAAALMLRILVPAGFMPMEDHGRIVVTICSGYGPMTMSMPMKGMSHHDDGQKSASDRCAFASLALPVLGSVDPALLAEQLAFILALGFFVVHAQAPKVQPRLRPPLRGPPSN